MSTEKTPLQRYEDAVAPGGWLTGDGWVRLGKELTAAADALESAGRSMWETARDPACRLGRARCLRDRAADCRARAARMRAA